MNESIHPKTTVRWIAVALASGAFACATTACAHPKHESEPTTPLLTNRVTISVEGNYRLIRANGVPDHETGQFPNRGNPNTIGPQSYTFIVPLKPRVAEKPTRLSMQPFGVALNGVVFDPFAAEWWDDDPRSGWQYEPLSGSIFLGQDTNNAHVQPGGAYHYHGVPIGLVKKLSGGKVDMTLIGWAADGFPIYASLGYSDPKNPHSALKVMKPSYQLRKGQRPSESGPGGRFNGTFVEDYEYVAGSGDLDECNGCFGPTPEFPEGTYHYFVTEEFPFIPRYFKGTPDATFSRPKPPGGFGGPGGFGPPGGFPPPGRGGPRGGPEPHRRGDFGPPEFGEMPFPPRFRE